MKMKNLAVALLCVATTGLEVNPLSLTGQSSEPLVTTLQAEATANIAFDDRVYGRGKEWRAGNGVRLVFQQDGNLVAYQHNKPLWATGTDNTGANRLKAQRDGNFVLYDDNRPLWASNTFGSGHYLRVQNDGNLVIYRPGHHPIWSTDTWGGRQTVFDAARRWQNSNHPPALMAMSTYLQRLKTGYYNNRRIGDGECVALVKHATGKSAHTSNWKKGTNVIRNGRVKVGSAIATFFGDRGQYEGHTAIFGGYDRNRDGFYVWHQNWEGRYVTWRFIDTSGSRQGDADNYYVIQPF